MGLCESANWQCANNTISKERGGDYCTIASCQGMLSKGQKREKGWGVLIGGWCESECHGMFHQQLSMSAHPPIPCPWGMVTCVYHSQDTSFLDKDTCTQCKVLHLILWLKSPLCTSFQVKWECSTKDLWKLELNHPCFLFETSQQCHLEEMHNNLMWILEMVSKSN